MARGWSGGVSHLIGRPSQVATPKRDLGRRNQTTDTRSRGEGNDAVDQTVTPHVAIEGRRNFVSRRATKLLGTAVGRT